MLPSRPEDPAERAMRRQLLARALLSALEERPDLPRLVALVTVLADAMGAPRAATKALAEQLEIDRSTLAHEIGRVRAVMARSIAEGGDE